MKAITRSKIYLPMAAMILTAALILPVAAQQQVPFKGSLQGHDTDSACSPPSGTCVVVTTTGTGLGTLVGEFSFTQTTTVNRAAGTSTGAAHWIAANGDSIDTTIAGSGGPADVPGLLSITEINTITGGTGRFAGVQGSFTVTRLASPVTFMTSGSFQQGTITPPGASH